MRKKEDPAAGEILNELHEVQAKLDVTRHYFDLATDNCLIESYIYDIMSLNKKYEYYLKLAKEANLRASGFPAEGGGT